MITVRVIGADAALAAVSFNPQAIAAACVAVATASEAIIAPYPSPSGRRQPPRSAAQRRLIFAKIRAGEIPYRRSGAGGGMLGSWRVTAAGRGAILSNSRAYAIYVVGSPGQAAYHAGTWTNEAEMAKKIEESGVIQKVVEAIITKELGL